jgi:hypothetical protein
MRVASIDEVERAGGDVCRSTIQGMKPGLQLPNWPNDITRGGFHIAAQ